MTRRIDWRAYVSKSEMQRLEKIEADMTYWRSAIAVSSVKRKRIISRAYQKAARAAKRGK